jgi:palmitoyltransferase
MFVVLVCWLIGLIYYAYTFLVWLPKAEDDWKVLLLLAVFHVLFIMLIWSFIQSMTTDPGQVPVFWGFHLGDPENKRRRYCLMCNIFKPERCHHCSSCNRCVLNMDHHCPWINNCIGFWNRKFFILLLIYVLLVTYFVVITMGYAWIESIQWSLDTYYFSKNAKDQEKLIKNLII